MGDLGSVSLWILKVAMILHTMVVGVGLSGGA